MPNICTMPYACMCPMYAANLMHVLFACTDILYACTVPYGCTMPYVFIVPYA